MKLLQYLIYLLLSLRPVAALAMMLQAQAIETIAVEGNGVRLGFKPACGAKFYGLLSQRDHDGNLQLAALVERDQIFCAKIPEKSEITVDFIDIKHTKKLTAMALDRPLRIRLASVSGIKRQSTTSGGTTLSLVYESTCRPIAGVILRRNTSHQIEVGIAEQATNNKCPSRSAITEVKSLTISSGSRLLALRTAQQASIYRQHQLRIAPVNIESIRKVSSNRGFSTLYRRRCNEAPVGLIVGGTANAPQIGVLVAHYPNFRCLPNQPEWTWLRFTSSDLTIGDNAKTFAPSKASSTLSVGLAARYSQTAKGLNIAYIKGCSRPLGVVYSPLESGKLAIGILTASNSSSCKEAPSEVSLTHTFVSPSSLTKDLIPLKLKG